MALDERDLTGLVPRDCMSMAYAVGQTIEVCLEFDMPPAQGVRFVVATFVNERGDVAELTDMPSGARLQPFGQSRWGRSPPIRSKRSYVSRRLHTPL